MGNKKVPSGAIHPEDEGQVHPVTSSCFRSFHSHVDIVNTYFAKKCTRSVKPFHFNADPRVSQKMVVGPKCSPARRDFITVKAVPYVFYNILVILSVASIDAPDPGLDQ